MREGNSCAHSRVADVEGQSELKARTEGSFMSANVEEARGFEDELRVSKNAKRIIVCGGIKLVHRSVKMQIFVLQAGDNRTGISFMEVLCWLGVG